MIAAGFIIAGLFLITLGVIHVSTAGVLFIPMGVATIVASIGISYSERYERRL